MGMGEFVDAVLAVRAADPGLADAGVEALHGLEIFPVDVGFAEVDFVAGAHGRAEVAGVDRGRQTVFTVVRQIDRLIQIIDDLDQAIDLANDCEYGLTSSIYTRDLSAAMRACNEIDFGETYINRENFEAMQGFHAGIRKSGIGGADGKHGVYEFTHTHVVYIQI